MSTRARLGFSAALQSQPEPWPNQNSNPPSNQKTGKLTSRGKVLCLQFAKYPYTNKWGVISDLQLGQMFFFFFFFVSFEPLQNSTGLKRGSLCSTRGKHIPSLWQYAAARIPLGLMGSIWSGRNTKKHFQNIEIMIPEISAGLWLTCLEYQSSCQLPTCVVKVTRGRTVECDAAWTLTILHS